MTAATPTTPKKPSKKKAVLITFLILACLIAAGVYWVTKIMTGPSVGQGVATLPVTTKKPKVELEQFDGPNVSFIHPTNYIDQTTKSNVPNEIESHTYVSSGMIAKVLTIAITKMDTGRLDDVASYSMRATNTQVYKMKTTVIKNETVTVFNKVDNQEFQKTAFWPHQGKLLTFSMTGSAADAPAMNVEYDAMLASFFWH